jgi:hypothetical protein
MLNFWGKINGFDLPVGNRPGIRRGYLPSFRAQYALGVEENSAHSFFSAASFRFGPALHNNWNGPLLASVPDGVVT